MPFKKTTNFSQWNNVLLLLTEMVFFREIHVFIQRRRIGLVGTNFFNLNLWLAGSIPFKSKSTVLETVTGGDSRIKRLGKVRVPGGNRIQSSLPKSLEEQSCVAWTWCLHLHEWKVYCDVPQRTFPELNVLPQSFMLFHGFLCSWNLPFSQEVVSISLSRESWAVLCCSVCVPVHSSDESEGICVSRGSEFIWSRWGSWQSVCAFACFVEVVNTEAW
jgi:hypothetical protein